MFFNLFFALSITIFTLVVLDGRHAAAQSLGVVCVAGECLEGYSNTTIGVVLSAAGQSVDSVLLLPGQYSSTTSPQLLHDFLTSSSATLSPSAGFDNASSLSLPLNLALEPGLAIYSDVLYAGTASFTALPNSTTSSSTSISAKSISLSSNTWAAMNSSSNSRFIIWSSIPDVSQLPFTGTLTLLDIESASCSPTCSGAGVCSPSGTCSCPAGFTGTSCESCASGFFGTSCQACPANCTSCDDGISGSGRCLVLDISNAPSTCNCINGECSSTGSCTCNTGWTTASNGTACAQCADGFYLTTAGDCKACELDCTECTDLTGTCVTCKTDFTVNANDKTQCIAPAQQTSDGTDCPDGTFSDSGTCTSCSPSCSTCTAGTSSDCILCASGTYAFNGGCVSASDNGVCEGTNLIADNTKNMCDTCHAKCTSCEITGFTTASTVDELQCTGCIPGSFLSGGNCVDSCPSGTFLSPTDNLTCTTCDTSCSTCADSSTLCLTCSNNQLAFDGKCVSSCPSGTFTSSGQCITCHPDCATCSGTSFNQCLACPADRPVLSNGRCLPTCGQSQYFDSSSSSCQSCDSTCSSCSGSGASNCLACSSSTQVLQGGSCTDANCTVISGLGVCLSELVDVPTASGSSSSALPTVTGINQPTVVTTSSSTRLEWWEILLMALGCAFIFLVIVWLWRRRARKQRAKRTAQFAQTKNLEHKTSWRWRFANFLFGPSRSTRRVDETEMRLRQAEEARHDHDMDELIGQYKDRGPWLGHPDTSSKVQRRISANTSIYSELTGAPRRMPETRQPVKDEARVSASTVASWSSYYPPTYRRSRTPSPAPQRLQKTDTGTSGASKNPFRKNSD